MLMLMWIRSRYSYSYLTQNICPGLYLYGTTVRDTATWAKVKAASDGLKVSCDWWRQRVT